VQVGTIGIRAGVPADVDQWGWTCGFYPQRRVDGTAANFEIARSEFEAAWRDGACLSDVVIADNVQQPNQPSGSG